MRLSTPLLLLVCLFSSYQVSDASLQDGDIVSLVNLASFDLVITSSSSSPPGDTYLSHVAFQTLIIMENMFVNQFVMNDTGYAFHNVSLDVRENAYSPTLSQLTTTFDGNVMFGGKKVPDLADVRLAQEKCFEGQSKDLLMDLLRTTDDDFFKNTSDIIAEFDIVNAQLMERVEPQGWWREYMVVIIGSGSGFFATVILACVYCWWSRCCRKVPKDDYDADVDNLKIERKNTSPTAESMANYNDRVYVDEMELVCNDIFRTGNSTDDRQFDLLNRQIPLSINLSKVRAIPSEDFRIPALPPSESGLDGSEDSRDSLEASFSPNSDNSDGETKDKTGNNVNVSVLIQNPRFNPNDDISVISSRSCRSRHSLADISISRQSSNSQSRAIDPIALSPVTTNLLPPAMSSLAIDIEDSWQPENITSNINNDNFSLDASQNTSVGLNSDHLIDKSLQISDAPSVPSIFSDKSDLIQDLQKASSQTQVSDQPID